NLGSHRALADDARQEHRARDGLPGRRAHDRHLVLRRADGPRRELRHDGARLGAGGAHSRHPAARRLDRRDVAGPWQNEPRMATLESGTRLGVYEVVEAIGSGGMGTVYRARDTRLPRDAAIKVS